MYQSLYFTLGNNYPNLFFMPRILCFIALLLSAVTAYAQPVITPVIMRGFYQQRQVSTYPNGHPIPPNVGVLINMFAHGFFRHDVLIGVTGYPITPDSVLARPAKGINQNWSFHFAGSPNWGVGQIGLINYAPLWCPIKQLPSTEVIEVSAGFTTTLDPGYIRLAQYSQGSPDSTNGRWYHQKQDGLYILSDWSSYYLRGPLLNPLPHLIPGMQVGDQRVTFSGINFLNDSICWPPTGPIVPVYDTLEVSGQGMLRVNGGPAQQAILVEHRRRIRDSAFGPINTAYPYPTYGRTFDFLDVTTGLPLLSYSLFSAQFDTTQRWTNFYTTFAYWSAARYPAASPLATRPAAARWSLGPNPVTTTLQVRGLRPGPAAILNAQGRRLPITLQADQVDVSTLSPGVYVLEAEGQRARFVKE